MFEFSVYVWKLLEISAADERGARITAPLLINHSNLCSGIPMFNQDLIGLTK